LPLLPFSSTCSESFRQCVLSYCEPKKQTSRNHQALVIGNRENMAGRSGLFMLGADHSVYRQIAAGDIEVDCYRGRQMLHVAPEVLETLACAAFTDVSFFFRRQHLQQMAAILKADDASENDRYVASTLLRNAVVAAAGQLPSCQDTGTATVIAQRGERVLTGVDDALYLSRGIGRAYGENNLRYSQLAPLDMFTEVNTGTNLPAQIEISAVDGCQYQFLFVAKGAGSANKTALYQETKALLQPRVLDQFLRDKLRAIGVAACPPYHLVVVIGGTSPELTLKTVKLATTGQLDSLPTQGSGDGMAFRDCALEARIVEMTRAFGLGAQFGGRYFALDARVIRLPRHGGSCPVGIGLSCSADRNIKGKITAEGVFLEELERHPECFLEQIVELDQIQPVAIDLEQPLDAVRRQLSGCVPGTRLSLSGTLIVARDIAHARFQQRLESGAGLPEYLYRYPVYYAGPAKTPPGMVCGSFGPTTAQRMDGYVAGFMQHGASLIMLAKGNRAAAVTAACQKFGGFYLGTIGGAAALVAKENITAAEVIDYPELGMEAVYRIRVHDFPAFVIADAEGGNLYDQLARG